MLLHGSDDETGTMADGHTTLDGKKRHGCLHGGESLGENGCGDGSNINHGVSFHGGQSLGECGSDQLWGDGSNKDHGYPCGALFQGSEPSRESENAGTEADGHATLAGNKRFGCVVSFHGGESFGESGCWGGTHASLHEGKPFCGSESLADTNASLGGNETHGCACGELCGG